MLRQREGNVRIEQRLEKARDFLSNAGDRMRSRSAKAEGRPLPVSDLSADPPSTNVQPTAPLAGQDDERPPLCPRCNKRLVILATQPARDDSGGYIRQQLWGCPRGHATAIRRAGIFQPVTLLAELVG
jgi:hypothetical protein